ncbi:hypothetical protein HMPREF0972_02071 [Actinomyces sp. oral taxon 848 str. F0332]|nr:hypothetical protein HMPREF0972_02071 [Actinomyces sp. oral taxon 848 str. F0332]
MIDPTHARPARRTLARRPGVANITLNDGRETGNKGNTCSHAKD